MVLVSKGARLASQEEMGLERRHETRTGGRFPAANKGSPRACVRKVECFVSGMFRRTPLQGCRCTPVVVFVRIESLLLAPILATSLAGACGSTSEPPPTSPPAPPVLTFVSGALADDTVLAAAPDPIVVEVRDAGGHPEPAVSVLFSQTSTESPVPGRSPYVLFGTPGSGTLGQSQSVSTDAAGRASVGVTRGPYSGKGIINAGVTAAGKTVYVTSPWSILPGKAASFELQPHDTAIYVGALYRLRPTIFDVGGNPILATPRYMVNSAAASIDTDGTVTGRRTGRVVITGRSGDAEVTRYVSVVPKWSLGCVSPRGVLTFESGGFNIRVVVDSNRYANTIHWRPDRRQFAFTSAGGLYLADSSGSTVTRASVPDADLGKEYWPRYDVVGQWIYFVFQNSIYGGTEIWRVRSDGSGLDSVTTYANDLLTSDWDPAPSPDGTRVVFATNRQNPSYLELAFVDLATRSLTITSVEGVYPRWSPDGTRLAFLGYDGNVKLASASATSVQNLSTTGDLTGGLDWSADGLWLVAGLGEVALIDVQTGEVLPLAFTVGCSAPVFLP